MCFVLYLASDRVRREIPWDEQDPRFHVKHDGEDTQRTRIQFSKTNLYYLGSHNGCGCGFRREPDWSFDQREKREKEAIEDNQRRMFEYLQECLADEDEIELFGCWSGDEEIPAEKKRTIQLDDLVKREFYFEELERISVRKEAPAVPRGPPTLPGCPVVP